ncbi:MAG TPA: hypothetical protein PKC40_02020 [Saprospiraceae bacterium]|nr:hypothetical protein [Saprospiraceae bacterium]
MKKSFLFPVFISLLFIATSCGTSIKPIGKVNMISTRNIDSNFDYKRIKSYVGISKRDLKRTKGATIDEAIYNTVRIVPGGEFIMNAKLYMIDNKYFAVEGDVWGRSIEEYRGLQVGDKVQWVTSFGGKKVGVITGFIDDKECLVKEDGDSTSSKVSFDRVFKVR